jgi:hypothetical protein
VLSRGHATVTYVSRCTRSATLWLRKWRRGALLSFGETTSKLGRHWLRAGTGESVLDHWCGGSHGVDPIIKEQGKGAGNDGVRHDAIEVHRGNQPSQRRTRDGKHVASSIRRIAQASRGGRSGGSWLLPKRLGERRGTAALNGGRLAQASLPMSLIEAWHAAPQQSSPSSSSLHLSRSASSWPIQG